MGTQSYLWHFILSVLLCTLMALEGKDTTTATSESHLSVLRSTNSSSTGPAADSSNGSVAEADTPKTQHSLLGTISLSPSAMTMVSAEGRMSSTPATKMQEGGSLGMSAKSSALPTTGTGTTTAPSMGTDTGTASSPPLSSATRSHSSSSPPGEEEGSTMNQGDGTTTETSHFLPVTSPVSMMTMVGGEGRTDTAPTTTVSEWGSLGTSSGSGAVFPAFPTAGTGTTIAPESGTASSLSFSSTVLSHSSSSPSSSPGVSPAAPPSPQQSSTSSTTRMALATTSRPPTALVFSSPSSAAGTAQFPAGTETQGPATPRPVASTSPASETIEARPSATVGSSTRTPTPQLTSSALSQGQPPVQVMATSPPTGSNSPSTATASGGSSAITPPGEEEGSTMNQGDGTTTETSHFLPVTSPVSMMTMVGGEGRTDTSPTTTVSEWGSLGTSPGSGAVFPAFPTAGTGTTTAPESGTASSLSFSSTVLSHSSSSPSSSPGVSPAAPPSPQQSSTSSTTGMALATTSHPPTALVFSSPSSTAGTAGNEPIVNSPAASTASTKPMPSTSGTSSMGSSAVPPSPQQSSTSNTTGMPLATTSYPSTALVFPSPSSTVGNESEPTVNSPPAITASTNPVPSTSGTSSMSSPAVPPSPQQSSTSSTTGMPLATTSHPSTALVMATSPPSSSTATASAGSSATTPPGEGRSSTMNQGDRTTEPTANTSHSLPATSLTTLSMTNLSTSTSVNPSITTTCLTVSIKVQNVTEEEIQLSWSSSSSAGSLYSISVNDGKEINTRTTNETEAVIENLLPGHKYTISVALASCAGSNPASVTVRTDSGSCFERTEFCLAQSTGCSDLKGTVCSNDQAFSCRVWLKNETFNNTLYNSESESYIKMSESLKKEVLEAMHAELGNNHSDIFILGFRPGSVIADFLFLLPKEEAMDVGEIQTLLSNVLRSKFGSQSKVQTLSVQSSTDNISSWRAAVIVLGVLLGVALVLILLAILFYIHVRRRSGMDFSPLYTW